MRFIGFLVCLWFCVTLASEDTYRAGFIKSSHTGDLRSYISHIHDAAKLNVDILVLPSQVFSRRAVLESCETDNYDELVKSLSSASKQAGLYVVANLLERTKCQDKNQLIRSNLVFDREGNVASVYRKPVNLIANCTIATKAGSFTTDFGVTFGVLMEEDLVLHKSLIETQNFVVAGGWSSKVSLLSGTSFARSWAFAKNVNLVSSSGAYAGRLEVNRNADGDLNFFDLQKTGVASHPIVPPIVSISETSFTGEDLSLYAVKLLDMAASTQGYSETVCQGQFCCDFYVKTSSIGSKQEDINYCLAVFDGVRSYDKKHNIGTSICSVYICDGLKRTCNVRSENNSTNFVFEKISVSGDFAIGTIQYPIILTTLDTIPDQFNYEDTNTIDSRKVTVQIGNAKLFSFGILGRDTSLDTEKFSDTDSDNFDSLNDEEQDFIDYIWKRLKVLIFIVSIYVLEML